MSAVLSNPNRELGGWIQTFKSPHVSFSAFLRTRLRVKIKDSSFDPLEVVYGAGCAYVALKQTKSGQKPVVRAVVAQVEHLSGLAGASNIAWRVLDEERLGHVFTYSDGRRTQRAGQYATFGRIFNRCPRSVLEKLTETKNAGALSWRRSCWARVNANEAAGRRPLARGDIATLPEPMKFRDGIERQAFLVTQANPLQGIAFGVQSGPVQLGPISKLLVSAKKVDLDVIPCDEPIEVVPASHQDCCGYLIRTKESKRIIAATRDAGLANAFEHQWNAGFYEPDAHFVMGACSP